MKIITCHVRYSVRFDHLVLVKAMPPRGMANIDGMDIIPAERGPRPRDRRPDKAA
jgi:hypothetical protein